jgi:hypothetical protein
MQFFGQYYEIRDNEVNGFNRPTEALIDNGSYITGPLCSVRVEFPGFGGTDRHQEDLRLPVAKRTGG